MTEHEASGRTVEEAVDSALKVLGVQRENVEVSVLTEPSAGLLGLIGSKEARVLVSIKKSPEFFLEEYLKEMVEKEIEQVTKEKSNEDQPQPESSQ